MRGERVCSKVCEVIEYAYIRVFSCIVHAFPMVRKTQSTARDLHVVVLAEKLKEADKKKCRRIFIVL